MVAAATSIDRGKVAVLGACRGNCWCIGTSLDAWGSGGASPPPAPTSRMLVLASCAGLNGSWLPRLRGGRWFMCDAHWRVVGRDGETAPEDVSGRPSTLKTSR